MNESKDRGAKDIRDVSNCRRKLEAKGERTKNDRIIIRNKLRNKLTSEIAKND